MRISRFDIIRTFDKEIITYFNDLNNFFFFGGGDVFSFELPLFVDFIIQNTPNNMRRIHDIRPKGLT